MSSVSVSSVVPGSEIQLTITHAQVASFLSNQPRFAPLLEQAIRVKVVEWWKIVQEVQEAQQSEPTETSALIDAMLQLETRLKTRMQEMFEEGINSDVEKTIQTAVRESIKGALKDSVGEAVSNTIRASVTTPCESIQQAVLQSVAVMGSIRADTADIKSGVIRLEAPKSNKETGAKAEDRVFEELSEALDSDWDLRLTRNIPNAGDMVLTRQGFADILIEVKNHKENVNVDHISRFETDVLQKKCHGIIINVRSGFAGRNKGITIRPNVANKFCIYLAHNHYDQFAIRDFIRFLHRVDELNLSDTSSRFTPAMINIVTTRLETEVANIRKMRSLAQDMISTANAMTMDIESLIALMKDPTAQRWIGRCSVCNQPFDSESDKGFVGHTKNPKYPNCINAFFVHESPSSLPMIVPESKKRNRSGKVLKTFKLSTATTEELQMPDALSS